MRQKRGMEFVFRFPISVTLFISALLSIFVNTSDININTSILHALIDDDSPHKLFLLLALIVIIFFIEIISKTSFFNNLFDLKLVPQQQSSKLLSSSYFRFFIILMAVNLFTWINIGGYQQISSKVFNTYRILPLYPTFADLRTTVFGIECSNVTEIGDYISCGDRGNSWLYPTILLRLRVFRLEFINVNLLMTLTLLACTLLIFSLLRNVSNSNFILLVALLLLPPFVLNIERGNLDFFVFLLLALTIFVLLSFTNMTLSLVIACFLLFAASLLKFYPIVGFVPLLFYSFVERNKIGRIPLLAVISVSIITFLTIFQDVIESKRFGVYDLSGSYGLRNIYALLRGSTDSRDISWPMLIGILCILLVIFSNYLKEAEQIYFALSQRLRISLLLISTISTVIWIMGTNYYYRLVIIWIFIYLILYAKNSIPRGSLAFFNYTIFSTALACLLIPRTFAIIQSVLLVPVHLLVFTFVKAEFSLFFKASRKY